MGGVGSGRRWNSNAKETTEEYRSIDVRPWGRDGLLNPNQSFGWQWLRHDKVVASIRVRTELDRVVFTYRHRSGGEDWTDESYPVYIDWTTCHLGGRRPWFLCPAHGCGKRVAILYCNGRFACRHCCELVYLSQRETRDARATRKADRIREKLGWEPGILNGDGWKPKGMHWSTFDRLTSAYDTYLHASLAGLADALSQMKRDLSLPAEK